jgi:hypothetical protein
VRRAQLVAIGAAALLLPWCVLLLVSLPATARASNWALAWTGLDVAEAIAAVVTAVLLGRGDSRASLSAMAGATLLLADAWFDLCTSAPGAGRALAIADAAGLELPLAAAAIWLAVRLLAERDPAGGPRPARARGWTHVRAAPAVFPVTMPHHRRSRCLSSTPRSGRRSASSPSSPTMAC